LRASCRKLADARRGADARAKRWTSTLAQSAAILSLDEPEALRRLAELQPDGDGPVWLQIRRAIAQPIVEGRWPPGSRVPGEWAVAERFNTSRMTAVKAMQSLVGSGLVERRRKVGTVVAARAQERPVFEIWDTADLVRQRGQAYEYKLLSCAFVGDGVEERALLGVPRSVQLLHMRCLHLADGAPFQFEDRLVNVDAAPGITCQPLSDAAPGLWLLAHVPWTEAQHAITACEADESVADLLGLRHGAACLLVERRTWNEDAPVTLARLWHPGTQHRLVGRFAPGA
jgi:GntR family histidine utilization transcriptional repressor